MINAKVILKKVAIKQNNTYEVSHTVVKSAVLISSNKSAGSATTKTNFIHLCDKGFIK